MTPCQKTLCQKTQKPTLLVAFQKKGKKQSFSAIFIELFRNDIPFHYKKILGAGWAGPTGWAWPPSHQIVSWAGPGRPPWLPQALSICCIFAIRLQNPPLPTDQFPATPNQGGWSYAPSDLQTPARGGRQPGAKKPYPPTGGGVSEGVVIGKGGDFKLFVE